MRRLLILIRAWLPRHRAHSRALGPVVIDPDVKETIHVYGKAEDTK